MRRRYTHGVVSLAIATLFAVGVPGGASASTTPPGAHAATSSGLEAAPSHPGAETLRLTPQGSGAAPTPATHALRPSGVDASTLLGFWVGGGALALATSAILVAIQVRRTRKETDSAEEHVAR